MATAKCTHCRQPYWNYRPPPVPLGYCSQPCFDARKKKAVNPKYEDEQAVIAVNSELQRHYREIHHSSDLPEWFDCPECIRLDQRKIDALTELA
jgi:hypothetical protein